jgi:hypothetical protein
MKPEIAAVTLVSALLLIYTIFATLEVFMASVLLVFSLSPLLVIWMVWVVLRHGTYHGGELEAEQEFGYADEPSGK